MITGREPIRGDAGLARPEKSSAGDHRISRMEQQSRAGHRVVTLWLETAPEAVYQLERLLFDANCRVHALLASENASTLAEISHALNDAGVIALVCGAPDAKMQERIRQKIGAENFLRIEASQVEEKPEDAANRMLRIIEEQGFVSRFAGD
jgi:hypothetical protein